MLKSDDSAYYVCALENIVDGQRYAFRINGEQERPDPASRWQPDGVHHPSAVWRADTFEWSDGDWKGVPKEELVLYEIHVGAFTEAGTLAAMIPRLKALRDLGVTAIELMPVAQFSGRWNWGYDGVYWNSVHNTYGGPHELQCLVNACHEAGVAVILDVVYTHFGPEGNYLSEFGPYVTERFRTPWGPAVNYNEQGSTEVRSFVLNNVRQWIRDFHIDGIRLDAIHSIYDHGARHILAEIKATAIEEAGHGGRIVHIIAESNLNDARLLMGEEDGGYGVDAQWNDDFHHCVHTLLTHEAEGYYRDFSQPTSQLVKVLNRVFAYDGELSSFRGHRHGVPVERRSGDQFIVSVQTHSQVGNRARGERLSQLTESAQLRLAASLMLLSPYTPLLFMGEEYGETSPFPFFCDFSDAGTRSGVRLGRRRAFPELAGCSELPDPLAEATFQSARLNWSAPLNPDQLGLRQLYQDLLAARRQWPALRNCQHRTAQLLTSIEGHSLLWLVRGDPADISEQIEICFNPTQHTATIPGSVHKSLETILRSDDIRYAGSAYGRRFWGQLNPYECIAFRRIQVAQE